MARTTSGHGTPDRLRSRTAPANPVPRTPDAPSTTIACPPRMSGRCLTLNSAGGRCGHDDVRSPSYLGGSVSIHPCIGVVAADASSDEVRGGIGTDQVQNRDVPTQMPAGVGKDSDEIQRADPPPEER